MNESGVECPACGQVGLHACGGSPMSQLVERLQQRIDALEADNRRLIGIIDRLTQSPPEVRITTHVTDDRERVLQSVMRSKAGRL